MHTKPRLWSKDFVLAVVVNIFISMVFYLLMTSMALYAVERFRASDSAAGLASSGFIIGAVLSRVYAGKFLDLVGRRRMVVGALVVFAVASLFYVPASDLALLIGVRILHGVAFGTAATALAASIVGLIPPSRRGEGVGYYGLSVTIATALGPLLAVLLSDGLGYEALFWFGAVCSISALLASLAIRLPERTPSEEERATMWRFRLSDVFDPDALPIAIFVFFAGAAFSGVLSFLTSFARAEQLVAGASYFFIAYAVGVFAVRLVVGRLQDRYGDNIVMYPTIALFAAGLALTGLAHDEVSLLVAAVLLGLGFGGLLPTGQVIAVNSAPDRRVGTATATYYLMLDAGSGLAPILLGMLIPLTGYSGMYLALAILAVGAGALYHFVHGHKRRRPALATVAD